MHRIVTASYRITAIMVMLLIARSPAVSQEPPKLPDGFTYIGAGTVQGTNPLMLTSPTSATLLSIVPDGTEVRRGDLVAAVDDRRLNTALTRQQTATKQAADNWKVATEQLESARQLEAIEVEIAVQSVRLAELDREQQLGDRGTHAQRVAAAEDNQRQIKTAMDLLRSYLKRLDQSAEADPGTITETKLKLLQAKSGLRQAEMQLEQLQGPARTYLQAKLDLAVLRAEANQLKVAREQQTQRQAAETHATNRKNVLKTLTNKLKEIEEQIAQCQMFAPIDGFVQHTSARTAPGTPLRARQHLLSIVSTVRLTVITSIDQKQWQRIKAGQKAIIRVGADEQYYQGVVKPTEPIRIDVPLGRRHDVTVELTPPYGGLRPGMLAHVGIEISDN